MQQLTLIVLYAVRAYMLLIFIYVMGSWFPQWRSQGWYQTVSDLVQPYLALFKALPLRMGMIDLTPMLAIFVLILVEWMVSAMLVGV